MDRKLTTITITYRRDVNNFSHTIGWVEVLFRQGTRADPCYRKSSSHDKETDIRYSIDFFRIWRFKTIYDKKDDEMGDSHIILPNNIVSVNNRSVNKQDLSVGCVVTDNEVIWRYRFYLRVQNLLSIQH